MNRFYFALVALLGALLPLVLDSALKGVALLAVAALCAAALGRASAATRHLVWFAALACALVLPLCSWLLPGWRVLPAWMRWEEIPRRQIVHPTVAPAPASAPAPEPSWQNTAVVPTPTAPREIEPPVAASQPPESASVAAPKAFRVSATGLFAIWAAGAALLVGRLAWSALALGRVARRAAAVRGGRIAVHAEAIAGELGLRRGVPVWLGDTDAMPMVWGVLRPRLLLPVAAADWPDARLRGVLLHELAHLRRRDPLALLVAQLALALHWFNPLAWVAVRRLRAEQERACDDFVLRHGIRASEYATDLLAVATGLRAQPFTATALTMAHPARIEGRIVSILDAARNRASVTRWLVFATVLLAAVIAVPLAMVRAAEEKAVPVENRALEAPKPSAESVVSAVVNVVTTADSAEISVDEKRGALAFVTGEGAQARVIVHEFGGGSGAIAFRVSADDRQGKWWDQARVVRDGEFEASTPELPGDWLPRGRVVFLPSPVKRADGAVVFAEIESASGKSVLAVRFASQKEIGDANYRQIPRTCPDTEIGLVCRIYALGTNAPAKAVILPVMAADDLTGPPRGALAFPTLTLKPGLPGKWDRLGLDRAENVEATATLADGRVHVDGALVVRLPEGKYASAAEAFRQNEEAFRKGVEPVPRRGLPAKFSATLGRNDALVVPIDSAGMFPEALVASMTALPRKLSRVRWMPPEARAPIELDGWVLTWPRAEQAWFGTNFDYQGLPQMIARKLEMRSDTTMNGTTSEAVGTLKQEEVERLVTGFRARTGVAAERVERFSAKQNTTYIPNDSERTHFQAAGEGASVLPATDELYISPGLKWDAPVLRHMSAPASYGLYSGTSFCVLLPGPADPEKIRMLVLRCVDPDLEPRPKSAAISPQEHGQAVRPKLADSAYTKSGIALEEFDAGSMKWGEEQNGLYVGIRVAADAEWRIGGEVKMELWACNPSGQEVKFSRNSRADIGLSVIAQDKDGKKHFADIARFDAYPVYIHLLLPPRHVVKLKEFVVKLGAMKSEKPEWGWVYLELTPGDYQIRAKWSDPHPQIANQGEWTGEIESGVIKVKLVAAGAAEKPGANVTDPAYGTGPVTPLMYRAAAGDLASVQKLIDAGEDVNARTGDQNAGGAVVGGITPLLIACRDGYFEVAQALLAAGATVDKAKSANGRFPLFEALAGAKDEAAAAKLMALLLDHGADPNERELHAGSTLHMAVLRDWKSAVRLLVARGANPAAGVGGFKTPATLAREKGLKEMADLLDELAKAPAAKLENPKTPEELAKVDIDRDGAISLNRVVVTLEQLKTEAAKPPKQAVEIHAEKDVPYAKVVEVVEALKAAGAGNFYFRAAQVGDGKFHVANRTGEYDFGGGRKLYLCRPSGQRQWFTIIWPGGGAWPRSRLSLYPNVSDEAPGQWAVVWEPGAEVLWWADGSDVGKMRVTDPAAVIVTREGRENNFSRDFGLPDEVKEQFRRLGMVIGRDRTPGREGLIGGNTGGQEIFSAETQELWSMEGTVTDAEDRPLADVLVRISSNREIARVKTDAQGKYHADFRLDFGTLAQWRAIRCEPVIEGFTERDMAKAGEFNALLQSGEQPQRVRRNGESDFQPGPIPRFATRDIVPGEPGRADFVMLAAREVTGEIVTADGRFAPPHWVVAATPEQRPGYNAAIQLSDAEGRFRLKGIPANKPVIFTVNPDGKPSETSKSVEETFESAGPHEIRITVPEGGSGHGALKVERVVAHTKPQQ